MLDIKKQYGNANVAVDVRDVQPIDDAAKSLAQAIKVADAVDWVGGVVNYPAIAHDLYNGHKEADELNFDDLEDFKRYAEKERLSYVSEYTVPELLYLYQNVLELLNPELAE